MADRSFVPSHNVIVDLDVDAPGADQVAEILTFLSRSRIAYAITVSPSLSLDVLRDFWTGISYDKSSNPPVIRTTVGNHSIGFSAIQLRRVLRLGTDENDNGPTEYSEDFIAGALSRMGYVGPRRGRNFTKSFVYGKWRFLWHIMAHVFSARKSGFDELSPALLSGLLSLVYNKPMALSRHIFDMFIGQVTGSVKSHFLLYPRFTMLLIHYLIPDFPPVPSTLQVNVVGLRAYNICFTHDTRKPEELRPTAQPLFGSVVDPNYVAPLNNGWQEGESDALVIASRLLEDASPMALETADPKVIRIEGKQEIDNEPSEKSSDGLKLLLNVALKGKRKVSDMEGEQSMLRSGRRTRSASRQLLIENVSQEEVQLEKDDSKENIHVPISSEAEAFDDSVREESTPLTESSPPLIQPSLDSSGTTIGTADSRISRLESKVRKLKKANKKLTSKLESVTNDTRINKLESKVRELSSFGVRVSDRLQFVSASVTEQNKAYSLLIREKSTFLDMSNDIQRQVKRLKRKVRKLHKNESAQGGVRLDQRKVLVKSASDSDDAIMVDELPGSSTYVDPVRRSSRRTKND